VGLPSPWAQDSNRSANLGSGDGGGPVRGLSKAQRTAPWLRVALAVTRVRPDGRSGSSR
jgi:hypothetical protein